MVGFLALQSRGMDHPGWNLAGLRGAMLFHSSTVPSNTRLEFMCSEAGEENCSSARITGGIVRLYWSRARSQQYGFGSTKREGEQSCLGSSVAMVAMSGLRSEWVVCCITYIEGVAGPRCKTMPTWLLPTPVEKVGCGGRQV